MTKFMADNSISMLIVFLRADAIQFIFSKY